MVADLATLSYPRAFGAHGDTQIVYVFFERKSNSSPCILREDELELWEKNTTSYRDSDATLVDKNGADWRSWTPRYWRSSAARKVGLKGEEIRSCAERARLSTETDAQYREEEPIWKDELVPKIAGEAEQMADEARKREEEASNEADTMKKEREITNQKQNAKQLRDNAKESEEEAKRKEVEMNKKEEAARKREEKLKKESEKARRMQQEALKIEKEAIAKQEELTQLQEEITERGSRIKEQEEALLVRELEMKRREEEARRKEYDARRLEEKQRKETEEKRKEIEARRMAEEIEGRRLARRFWQKEAEGVRIKREELAKRESDLDAREKAVAEREKDARKTVENARKPEDTAKQIENKAKQLKQDVRIKVNDLEQEAKERAARLDEIAKRKINELERSAEARLTQAKIEEAARRKETVVEFKETAVSWRQEVQGGLGQKFSSARQLRPEAHILAQEYRRKHDELLQFQKDLHAREKECQRHEENTHLSGYSTVDSISMQHTIRTPSILSSNISLADRERYFQEHQQHLTSVSLTKRRSNISSLLSVTDMEAFYQMQQLLPVRDSPQSRETPSGDTDTPRPHHSAPEFADRYLRTGSASKKAD